jgi:2-C-methyl-D-erythritol 4-phosphate cytidylyltransferase
LRAACQTGGVQTWAIVVAAGGGTRFGGAKQFARLGGATVLDRAVGTARESCDGVVVVLAPGAYWDAPADVRTTTGGATRSESVRAGLACVPDSADVIVVHDAARPLATRRLFASVIDAITEGADAAVPALPVVDTLKRVRDRDVVETVSREDLVAVQTPQAFRAAALRAAHARAGIDTDDAALVEAGGGKVVVVDGERRNLKLTLADDLELAQTLIEGART